MGEKHTDFIYYIQDDKISTYKNIYIRHIDNAYKQNPKIS